MATDGVDALLVEPGDATALASALARALTDAPLAARLRAAGAARAEDFSMTKLVAEYVAIYEEAIERRLNARRSDRGA